MLESKCSRRLLLLFALIATIALLGGPGAVVAADSVSTQLGRPATRLDAVGILQNYLTGDLRCLTPSIQAARNQPLSENRELLRAAGRLRYSSPFRTERKIELDGGLVIQFKIEAPSLGDARSRQDQENLVLATVAGLDQARTFFADRLGMAAPSHLDVLLGELGAGIDGFVIPSGDIERARIVLDSTPARGLEGAMDNAIHQYAHAVASATGVAVPEGWGEALATWAVMSISGEPDSTTIARINDRLARLHIGLLSEELELGAGNAIWFDFLEQVYGLPAVRFTVEELARGTAAANALDLGIRRASDDDLAAAFREFQLWTLLVGSRADGHHFRYASRLDFPGLASSSEGLPALSVQSDPAIGSLGAGAVGFAPRVHDGGLSIHFEGGFASRWDADVILIGEDGSVRRVPFELSADGRGDLTVPAQQVQEAILLIRNLDGTPGGSQSYTYAAHEERGYPVEFSMIEAVRLNGSNDGIVINWDTSSEQDLAGFNILRSREPDGPAITVTPVWVPAFGDRDLPTSYQFLDRSAQPQVRYYYRVEGITIDGLTSRSRPVLSQPSLPRGGTR